MVRITLEPFGELREFFGNSHIKVDLDDEASILDLFSFIDNRWGVILPAFLWNSKKQKFRGPIITSVNSEIIRDLNTQLKNNDKVQIIKAFVGG